LKGPETIVPDDASHSKIVVSIEPEAMYLPLGEKATAQTSKECAFGGLKIHSPVCASQTRIVQSTDPETMYFPLGENVAQETEEAWAIMVRLGGADGGLAWAGGWEGE